ncbi:unnamed protein product [Rotaria sp. Silwood1]|nr:unnamed protein product [Rotaria sp. Silwood1]CAF3397827.1 unnamed protein product [Rotaria sp. Silwood1]CAF4592622.1 unnamed protein product [Rotaria sp. Silwood1]
MFQQPFYPRQQAFPNNRGPTNHFMPSRPFVYRPNGPILNQSTHNFNFTRDFERFPMFNHGFTSIPTGNHPFCDPSNQQFEQQRWRQNTPRAQQQQQQQNRRASAFHFRDKSTSYFMTDPIITKDDRITIQFTKVHIGPNGDQQRVFVEQEFSNEKELNRFVRNLRHNFEKTYNNCSSDQNSTNTDESNCTDNKKPGVVVIEEPDEEPKIYQQQVYNANIETKRATASIITPPISPPTMESVPQPTLEDYSQSSIREHRRAQNISPSISQISSVSTARSHRRHKNKMKYRRQHIDNREEPKLSQRLSRSSFARQYPSTPVPPRFQQRFFPRDNDPRMKNPFTIPTNPNFQWKFNQPGFSKTRSRSYMPPMNDHFSVPPPTPPRFQRPMNPFVQSMHSSKFAQHRHKDFHLPPSPSKIHRSQRRKPNQPTTITENHIYPHHEQQQPRVQRTKSECRTFEKQQQQRHRSRSSTNHFQNFSPLQQPPIIQRHFTPFRSPPVVLPSVNMTTTSLFHPNQRRQFGHMQTQIRLINPFRLSTNRF